MNEKNNFYITYYFYNSEIIKEIWSSGEILYPLGKKKYKEIMIKTKIEKILKEKEND